MQKFEDQHWFTMKNVKESEIPTFKYSSTVLYESMAIWIRFFIRFFYLIEMYCNVVKSNLKWEVENLSVFFHPYTYWIALLRYR